MWDRVPWTVYYSGSSNKEDYQLLRHPFPLKLNPLLFSFFIFSLGCFYLLMSSARRIIPERWAVERLARWCMADVRKPEIFCRRVLLRTSI